MGNFSMVGKMSMPKASEKFQPYSETESKKGTGWVSRRLRFNVAANGSRHMLSVNAGSFKDGHGSVYTYTKSVYDSSGARVKDGEALQIPFKERLTSPDIQKVAEFRKFVLDLETREVRKIRKSVREKIDNGEPLTDDELEILGIESQEDAEERVKLAEKRRHEYISDWDFAKLIKDLLASGKYSARKFYIAGRREFQYNPQNQTVYESLIPNRIYLEEDGADEYARETLDILYGKDSLDTLSEKEKGNIYVKGWERAYESGLKKHIFADRMITIPAGGSEKAAKRAEALKKRFSVDGDRIMSRSIEVDLVDGSPEVEITEDMLTDEQREDLELGLVEMDDLKRDLGGSVYGDRVRESRFSKFTKGKGADETAYNKEDMGVYLPDDEGLPFDDPGASAEDSLFDDDDDIV